MQFTFHRTGLAFVLAATAMACSSATDVTSPQTEGAPTEPTASEAATTPFAKAVADGTSLVLRFAPGAAARAADYEPASIAVFRGALGPNGREEWQIAHGATVDASSGSLTVTLAEAATPGERLRVIGARVDGTQVDLGTVKVSDDPIVNRSGDATFAALTNGTRVLATLNTDAFYVDSALGESSRDGTKSTRYELARSGVKWSDRLVVKFGGTSKIDCTKLPAEREGQSYWTDPNVFRIVVDGGHQVMYQKKGATNRNDYLYHGHLTCDDRANTLTFNLPGRPLGDTNVDIHVYAVSKDGKQARKDFELRTSMPSIRVRMKQVRKDGENGCEGRRAESGNERHGRACDIYVTGAAVPRNVNDKNLIQGSRHPETNNWGNMREGYVRTVSDSNSLVFEGVVGPEGLDLGFAAWDGDGGSNLSDKWKVKSRITEAVCGLIPYCAAGLPAYIVINKTVGDVLKERGDDDLVGKVNLTLRNDSTSIPSFYRGYGIQNKSNEQVLIDEEWWQPISFDRHKGRGVTAWIRIDHLDAPWNEPSELL